MTAIPGILIVLFTFGLVGCDYKRTHTYTGDSAEYLSALPVEQRLYMMDCLDGWLFDSFSNCIIELRMVFPPAKECSK